MFEKELVRRGAEAELYKTTYFGKKALLKQRVKKDYRRAEFDEKIRTTRTKEEANLLHKAKALGVRTPVIFKVDKKRAELWMEFVEGKRLKDVLNSKNLYLCREVGEKVAKLHNANIIHGDLTTSNILLHNHVLVFIDFGLGFFSEKTEDKAVDLLVFKKTFEATHSSLMKGWELILEGYLTKESNKDVVKQLNKVESRVRYH